MLDFGTCARNPTFIENLTSLLFANFEISHPTVNRGVFPLGHFTIVLKIGSKFLGVNMLLQGFILYERKHFKKNIGNGH